jgi:hypothetical protein
MTSRTARERELVEQYARARRRLTIPGGTSPWGSIRNW